MLAIYRFGIVVIRIRHQLQSQKVSNYSSSNYM